MPLGHSPTSTPARQTGIHQESETSHKAGLLSPHSFLLTICHLGCSHQGYHCRVYPASLPPCLCFSQTCSPRKEDSGFPPNPCPSPR